MLLSQWDKFPLDYLQRATGLIQSEGLCMRQRMEKPVILTNTGKEQNWAPQKIEEKKSYLWNWFAIIDYSN